ncbi:MAG: Gfo/Idh/MocA family oxidoreductase [Clostridia bacterium]|nr:Gfo/Idh/MocA family oxidoreductase [Clostridia bacterium]MBQ4574691.1 Gfo/Idh/MocA family oxidoreductase [Clostridia bacterium]
MSEPIRLGLLGLGRAGNGMHRPELRGRQDKIKFYAVCDIIEERTKPFVEEFGSKAYTNYEDMLADPEIELISIATRSCDHYKHAKMALLAGKDVMLEKPFCMHPEECKDLIALGSQPAGPHLYIRHNRRFESGFVAALEIIKSGKLGRVFEVKLTRNGYQRRCDWQTINEFGGGQLLNWGPHIIDHSLRFCGGAYKDMYSAIRHVAAAGDCEDHIKIVFTGVNDCIVDMEISGGAALPTPEYRIYGSRGALVSEGNQFKLRYLDPNVELASIEADRETPGSGASFGNPEKLVWIEETVPGGGANTDSIWDHLYESIRHNVKYPIGNDEALAVIEVIEKVKAGTIFENK